MKNNNQDDLVKEIVKDLTSEIRIKEKSVLPLIGEYLKQERPYTSQQFNGLFGGKNNTFSDVISTRFTDFKDFYAHWLKGLIDKYESYDLQYRKSPSNLNDCASAVRIYNLLLDEDIRALVELFLERNFYKQIRERTRSKPDENLWAIWFGYSLSYGLLIAPKLIRDKWVNDKSEIRRVKYSYWTIGHVLSEGFVDVENNRIYRFKDLDAFISLYQDILKRLSVSPYEKSFYDLYITYLKN